jgi:DNA-binding transcriptional MerR regulator
MEQLVTVGRLAREAGCTVQTVRYYEQIGLLPRAARSAGNQRLHEPAVSERLAFIRHARELGFPVEAVRDLLRLSDDPERPCQDADRIARTHLADVERRMARLAALKAELERMVARCGEGGRIADCRVIEVLADSSHGHCLSPAHGDATGERAAALAPSG